MKKILLFVSIVFFALYSNKTNAQTIDSLVISQLIECPGQKANLDVFISQTAPLTAYNIVLQKINANSTMWLFVDELTNTSVTNHTFTNLFSDFYRVILVDPTLAQSAYPSLFSTADPTLNNPSVYSFLEKFIPSPSLLNVAISDDSLLCWYDTTATLTLNILNGGSPPYTISFDDGTNPIQTVTIPPNISTIDYPNLSAGTYNFTVTDFYNCINPTSTHIITSTDTIRFDAVSIDSITCFDFDDGQLTINNITGGTSPYVVDWYDISTGLLVDTGVSTGQILSPGDYYAVITDDNGCDTILDTITLINPLELLATTTSTDAICNGDNNGTITITIDSILQGSGAPFQYTQDGGAVWINFPPQKPTQVTLPTLFAGIYTNIRVRDVDSCEYNLPVDTIIEPPVLEFSTSKKDYIGSYDVSCFGVCDAEITIDSVWGGNLPPYGNSSAYYDKNGTIIIFADTLFMDSDTCAGNYAYTITDSLDCPASGSVTITEPPVFSIDATVAIKQNGFNLSCGNSCDGDITVLPNNGQGQISYYYINSLFAQDISPNSVNYNTACANTNGGDTLIAIDENGCADTNLVIITSPPPITLTMNQISENCALSNGQVWVSVSGGLPTYSYNWTSNNGGSFPNDSLIENLISGMYVVTVTDASLPPAICLATDSINVDSAFILVDPITVLAPCNGIDNGEITINTNGIFLSQIRLEDTINFNVIANYNSSYNPPLPALGGILVQNPNIDTVMTFDNLISSGYVLRVELYADTQGTVGCGSKTYPITVGAPVTMNATLDLALSELDLACFGYETDSIFIDVTDGFSTIQSPNNNQFKGYTIDPLGPQDQSIQLGANNFLTGAGSFPAGNHDIVITPNFADAFGNKLFTNCYDTVSVTVTEPDSLEFILGSVQTLCNGDSTGAVFVDTIFGGNSGDYSYIWRNEAGGQVGFSKTASSLPAGWYFLTVSDSLNCAPATIDSVEITEPTDITWTATIAAIDSCEYTSSTGAIVLTSLGGMGPHSYMWSGLDATGTPFTSSTQNLFALTSGMYYVTITDTNSCTKNDSVFIQNGENPSLDSNSFTNVSCFGAHDGSYIGIADSVNGSLSFPYTFYNFSSNAFVTGYIPSESLLGPEDTIIIRLKDNFGCIDSSFYVITEPDLLQIDSLISPLFGAYNVSCIGSLDGQITISGVTGGTPNYSYWLQDTSFLHPTSSDSVFTNLASRYYKAFVQDGNGCLDSLVIYLSQPDSLLIDSFNILSYIGGGNVSCFGFNDGKANVYVSGGNQNYSYSWSNGSVTDTAFNLFAITSYSVVVTDPYGCSDSASIILTEPSELKVDSLIATDLLCKGGDRGSATVYVSGANEGYSYLWDNSNNTIPTYINPIDTVHSMNDITAFADTLRAGLYNVEIKDTNNCYITASVLISEPTISITIDSLDIVQMDCYNFNNASAVVYVTGPQPLPYLYTLYDEFNALDTTSQGNVGFTGGLSSGNYVALVEDDLGCLYRDSFIIHPLDSVYIASVEYFNVSCNGISDGYISNIVPVGGGAPYEYSINGGVTRYPDWICNNNPNTCPTGFVFSGLAPGLYDVAIFDDNGCANSKQITITEPVELLVSITTNNYNNYQIECDGDSDTAFVNVSGGLPPYTLNYNGITMISNTGEFVANGIPEGNYLFTITDANSCSETRTIIFDDPPSITFTPFITDVFCQDSCSGEITVQVAGGVGQGNGANYTYQWYSGLAIPANLISGPAGTSYNIDDLCAGDYTIKAFDQNGCVGETLIPIGENALRFSNPQFSAKVDISCYEDCDGLIEVDVQGGVPNSSSSYYYAWDDALSQTINPALGLCEGLYTCTVTDMDGCSVTSDPISITEPEEFVASIILDAAILCNGEKGILSIATTGGTANPNPFLLGYSYSWSNGDNTSTSNCFAGIQTCFVEDYNGCSDTAHYTLIEPDILTILASDINPSDVKCKTESSGGILIMASGGTKIPGIPGTYDYELLDENGIVIDFIDNILEANFIGLSTGNYSVIVTDYNGCSYATGNIFIDEPDNELEINISAYDETCALDDSRAIVFPIGGTKTYTFEWDNSTNIATSNGANDSYTESLTAGDNTPHTVVVTDKNGCKVSETITLLGYKNVFLPDYSAEYDTTICIGGTININVKDRLGLSYLWTYNSGDNIGDTIASTANLTLITDKSFIPNTLLNLSISDDNCAINHIVKANIEITNLGPQCSADKLTVLLDESVALSELSNNFNSYEWSNSNGEILSNNNSFTYTPTQSDSFNLYVTNGICNGYCSVYITVGVLPFDAISPNGDGMNDKWVIRDLSRYPNAIVKVFNRWGQLIFEIDGPSYPNNDFNWEELNVGTYYYIIDLGNGDLPQTGPITIIK